MLALRSRSETKASLLPSGDQRGARSCFFLEVKRRAGEESSIGTSQIALA
jgi:hypothetical protein